MKERVDFRIVEGEQNEEGFGRLCRMFGRTLLKVRTENGFRGERVARKTSGHIAGRRAERAKRIMGAGEKQQRRVNGKIYTETIRLRDTSASARRHTPTPPSSESSLRPRSQPVDTLTLGQSD
jgi:hypothetical protein